MAAEVAPGRVALLMGSPSLLATQGPSGPGSRASFCRWARASGGRLPWMNAAACLWLSKRADWLGLREGVRSAGRLEAAAGLVAAQSGQVIVENAHRSSVPCGSTGAA